MSLALFKRLGSIRGLKVEDAQREVLRGQELFAQCEQAFQVAQALLDSELARKQGMAAQWRAERLALVAFDSQACDGQQARLIQCDRRIAEAQAFVQQRAAERDQAAQALHQAREALARRRVELAKAEKGVSLHEAQQRARDEALEEDEMDEVAVLRARPNMLEQRA